MLVRLLYVSRHALGPQLAETINALRGLCLTENARRGITGALAYTPRAFAQAIEGARDDVEALMAKISADPRHLDLRVIQRREIAARAFPDWAMAFAPVEDACELEAMTSSALTRFLIEAAQRCEGARAIPGYGPAPESSLNRDWSLSRTL